jgi:SpoVK/Ycf46/Vps4 family AAA+-type ATPase
MKVKLKLFDFVSDTSFPKSNSSIWLSKSDFDNLNLSTNELKNPIYLKVKSNDTLKKFVFYSKVECLNPKSELPKGFLYVPKELMSKSWIFENEMSLEIEILNFRNLNVAGALTIKLNEKEVNLWADDECNKAISNFLLNAKVIYNSQLTWLKPNTKNAVIGEITHIYPKPKNHLEPILVSQSETKILFEGLPDNKQKVIDFNNIGGLTHLVNKLREIIQIPLSHPDLLSKFDIKPPKGMLMYGPPGNGKTMIARAVAQSMGSNFITIEGSELTSKYVGEGERILKEKFELAQAKGNSVIFIDEIDSIASKRNEDSPEHLISIVAVLLALMDGMKSSNGVFVIGATNRLNAIDPALRRPGRFDLEFEIPLPSATARLDILSKYIKIDNDKTFNTEINKEFLKVLSELTPGYSGADISLLYREAVMDAIRKNIEIENATGKINLKTEKELIKLSRENFLNAIKIIKPTSLRNTENSVNIIAWDKLIAFEQLKQKISEVHAQCNEYYMLENLSIRLENSNLLFVGKKGSGKRTLINSFSKQFNYEIITIDILDLFSISLVDSSKEIEDIFIKAKQISPSIVYVKNIEKIKDNSFFALKIMNELDKLTNRNKIITIIQFENIENVPNEIKGYKGFENVFNFAELVEYDKINLLENKIDKKHLNEKLPIGQLLNNFK